MHRLALVLALIAGCGARTTAEVRAWPIDAAAQPDAYAEDAGRDAVVGDAWAPDAWALDAGDPCGADRSTLRGAVCEETIFGREASLECTGRSVDIVATGPGILRWECNGTRAEASFPEGAYFGTRMGHTFSLCGFTQRMRSDGCHWQSTQRIEGTLDRGTLALSYDEAVVLGDGTCGTPCRATASVGHP